MPIKTTAAKYRYNVMISFLEWPLILFPFFFLFLPLPPYKHTLLLEAGYLCMRWERFVDIRVVSEEKAQGLRSPTQTQVIFEMPQLLFLLRGAANEWVSTKRLSQIGDNLLCALR